MVEKIISGGQTGADQGGLIGAREANIPTGGMAPKGWKTETGPEPMLAGYGLIESTSANYQTRTKANIANSDGTAIFSLDVESTGTVLTILTCRQLSKPYIINPDWRQLRDWCEGLGIKVLNVAGNRASKDPLAFERARVTIVSAFS